MFKSEFQGGAHVEVFSCQGKEPLAKWKLIGSASIHKVYEKEAKSFVHVLEGAGTSTKIQLPKDSKQTLALVQRFLVVQVYVPLGQDFSVELGVSDMGNNKRRLLFSTAQKEITATPLHAKIPLTVIRRATWLNLCIDLVSIVSEAFRGQTYKGLDSLIISASCHLRKIFTVKTQPPDDTDDDDLYDCSPPTNNVELDSIPRACQFSADVAFQTQVLNMNKLRHAEFKSKPDSRPCSSTEPVDLNSSMKGRKDRPMHIAFGSKVPVPSTSAGKKPTSASSQREGSDSAGSRSSRSSHSGAQKHEGDVLANDGSHSPKKEANTRQRQASDPGTEVADLDTRVDKGSLKGSHTWSAGSENNKDDNFIQPHPPRQKSGDKSRHVVKVRPNSGRRERGDSQSASSDTSTSGRSGHHGQGRLGGRRKDSEESSDADRPGWTSDAAILKYASSRIRADEPAGGKEEEEGGGGGGSTRGAKTGEAAKPRAADSLSESDDLAGQSAPKGRTQRRKKKADRPTLNRMDSLSESEEAQRQRGKGRGEGGAVPRSGRREKEAAASSRTESVTSAVDSGITDVHSSASSRDNGGIRNPARPKQANTSRQGSKQTRADVLNSSGDQPNGEGKIYTFTSPPRSAPLRKAERSRHLEPKKLQLQKISETSAHSPPAAAPGGEDPALTGLTPSSPANREGMRSRYDDIIQRTPSPREFHSPQQSSSGDFSDPRREDFDSPKPTASLSPQLARKSLLTTSALQSHTRASAVSPLTGGSVSRLSIHSKKLREIPKSDPRLSDDYDWMKYQSNSSSLASSLEANMLASLRRQQLEEMLEEEPGDDHQRANNSFDIHNYGDDDLSSSSDDTATTYSTYKPPDAALRTHRYQDEMHFPSASNPLMQSNPRDWSNLFSPPIVLPSQKIKEDQEEAVLSPGKDLSNAFRSDKIRTKSTSSDDHPGKGLTESEEDEELDLLYDPCLNCYFDPRSGKYYELK